MLAGALLTTRRPPTRLFSTSRPCPPCSRVVVSALMKLAGGSPALAGELSVDAFLRQARSYDEATSSPVGWYLR